MTIDLICGLTVDEAIGLRAERDGQTYYFCFDHRLQKFLLTPAQSIAEHSRSKLMGTPEAK